MAQQDEQLEQLKRKYQPALNAVQQQGVRLHHLHIQNGKLFLQGEAPSNEAKNRVWDAIKGVDHTYSDLTADITINPSLAPPAPQPATQSASAPAAAAQTYTVQPGDNLSKISKQFYGDANKYMRIFEANRDQLQDPNKIKAGQVLKIPA